MIAILSNYPPEEAESVILRTVQNLKKLVQNKRILKKYINQLMMLSRLRKIELLTIKITETMPIHYDFESDGLYLKGIEAGRMKARMKAKMEGKIESIEEESARLDRLFVENLLLNSDFADDKIALLADVSVEFVKLVRLELPR